MKATEILVKEHSLILQAVDCLAQAKEKLEVYEQLPQEFFEMAVEFTHNFADKYHHFKEEFLMFGLLAQKKDGAFDGPISALRFEHERCREFINKIGRSIEDYIRGDQIATATLLENLAAYISILKRHIHSEDHIFFPMVDQELSQDEKNALQLQFLKEEEKMGGRDFFINSEKMVFEMCFLLGGQ
jgi:hemerythrin-like domain-containing protein